MIINAKLHYSVSVFKSVDVLNEVYLVLLRIHHISARTARRQIIKAKSAKKSRLKPSDMAIGIFEVGYNLLLNTKVKSTHYIKLVQLGRALELIYYMVIKISKEDIIILIYKFYVQGGGKKSSSLKSTYLKNWYIKIKSARIIQQRSLLSGTTSPKMIMKLNQHLCNIRILC